jgi:curved DNA-binding protein
LEEVMQGSVRSLSFHYGAIFEDCAGLGRHGFRPCMVCDGNGRVVKTHNYRVRIPAGVHDGQRLKLAGKGEWSDTHGLGGDFYLRVRLAGHPVFRVRDGALHYDLVLRPSALDAEPTSFVPTLNGRVLIKIPPGIRDGQILRVRNQGLPQPDGQRGDLFIMIRIQAAENTPDRQREFRQRASEDTAFFSRR